MSTCCPLCFPALDHQRILEPVPNTFSVLSDQDDVPQTHKITFLVTRFYSKVSIGDHREQLTFAIVIFRNLRNLTLAHFYSNTHFLRITVFVCWFSESGCRLFSVQSKIPIGTCLQFSTLAVSVKHSNNGAQLAVK